MLTAFKHVVRPFVRSPGFSAVAVVLLGLGIGLSTTIFSLTNVALIRPLPVPEGERLVQIMLTASDGTSPMHSPANYLGFRAAAQSFEPLAGSYRESTNVSIGAEPPEQIITLNLSPDFLSMLRVQPVLGRGFSEHEDQPGHHLVVLLTHHYWISHFNGDAGVLGRTLRVGPDRPTIIGVLPPVLDQTPLWRHVSIARPMIIWPGFETMRNHRWFNIAGRLKPGVSIAVAQAEMALLAAGLAHDHPAENAGQGAKVVPLASAHLGSGVQLSYWLMNALAVLVLAIACANLATIQIARSLGRAHEYAVRSALGADRLALMMPLLVESLVLSLAGGLSGLFLACGANRLIETLLPGTGPISMDLRVATFALCISLLTALVFGVVPAWLATCMSLQNALKLGSRSSTAGPSQARAKALLIVGQIALAFVLLSAAFTFTLALKRSLRRDLGWRYDHLIVGSVDLPFGPYHTEDARRAFVDQFRLRLEQLPGVTDVTMARWMPLFSYFSRERLHFEGRLAPLPGQEPIAVTNAVDRRYFRLLRIAFRDGRDFPEVIPPGSPPIVIINEAMARQFWPGQSPIGQRVRAGEDQPWAEIIGVVRDVQMAAGFDAPVSRSQIYRPIEQAPTGFVGFALSGSVSAATLDRSVREELARMHPDITMQPLREVDRILYSAMVRHRFFIATIGTFAGLGLLIALIGLYGVATQLVHQQRREFGVRLALGAARHHILSLVLGQGGRLVLSGLLFGAFGAYGVSRVYRTMVPELTLPGVHWQLAIAMCLLAAGLFACFVPARKATQIDPVVALKGD